MAKSKTREFTIGLVVKLWIDETIMAENLEQALTIAKAKGVEDVVSFDGVCNDSRISVLNVGDYAEVNNW